MASHYYFQTLCKYVQGSNTESNVSTISISNRYHAMLDVYSTWFRYYWKRVNKVIYTRCVIWPQTNQPKSEFTCYLNVIKLDPCYITLTISDMSEWQNLWRMVTFPASTGIEIHHIISFYFIFLLYDYLFVRTRFLYTSELTLERDSFVPRVT